MSFGNKEGLEEDGHVFWEKKKILRFAPGELIRPLVLGEWVFATLGKSPRMQNNGNTVQIVWLESKGPIDPQIVRKAIHLLAKGYSILQMSVVKHKKDLWFKRMMQLIVDFETTTDDYMEVYEKLLKKPYDMKNGPLWRVRFIPPVKQEGDSSFSSVLVYGVQHCITDGHTSMLYIRETVRLINCLMKGEIPKPVFSGLGSLLTDNSDKYSLGLMAKTTYRETTKTLFGNYSRHTSFNYVLPRPITKLPSMKLFLNDLTLEETKTLLTKCKEKQITVHSFISSCCSLAYLKLVKERESSVKEKNGEKKIKIIHSVDGRRYINDYDKTTSGCNVLVLYQEMKFSLSGNFWESAQSLHSDLKTKLNETKEPFKIMPLSRMGIIPYRVNRFLSSRSLPNKTTCHFLTTNMGNPKDYLPEPEKDDLVAIKYIVRSVKNEYAGIPCIIACQTFRNRFLISLDCSTSCMTEEVGRRYFDILCSLIKNIVLEE